MELIGAIGAGTLLGILSGLGIGGGSLLILYLTLILGMEPFTARGISLLFFFPAALVACFLKKGSVSFQRLLPGLIGGTVSAALFSYLTRILEPEHFQKAMGVLLLFIGLTEIFHKEKPAASKKKQKG